MVTIIAHSNRKILKKLLENPNLLQHNIHGIYIPIKITRYVKNRKMYIFKEKNMIVIVINSNQTQDNPDITIIYKDFYKHKYVHNLKEKLSTVDY